MERIQVETLCARGLANNAPVGLPGEKSTSKTAVNQGSLTLLLGKPVVAPSLVSLGFEPCHHLRWHSTTTTSLGVDRQRNPAQLASPWASERAHAVFSGTSVREPSVERQQR